MSEKSPQSVTPQEQTPKRDAQTTVAATRSPSAEPMDDATLEQVSGGRKVIS